MSAPYPDLVHTLIATELGSDYAARCVGYLLSRHLVQRRVGLGLVEGGETMTPSPYRVRCFIALELGMNYASRVCGYLHAVGYNSEPWIRAWEQVLKS